MDAAAFEQVYGAFGDFHAYFASLFGRRETREHSGHYLQALLVQSGERRNAENLSETVPGSARGMQRFLTDSPWGDEAIIGRLHWWLVSEGFSLSTANSDVQKLPATLYHRIADSLAYAASRL